MTPEAELERLRRELADARAELALAQCEQAASAETLRIISRSGFDPQTVLEALINSAVSLSGSTNGMIFRWEDGAMRARAFAEGEGREAFIAHMQAHPQPPGRSSTVARVALTGEVQNIANLREDPGISEELRNIVQTRAALGVPMKRGDELIGAIMMSKPEPGAYPERIVELVKTFADQAVIAIENARLFQEVQAKTRDLEEALAQQTATAEVLKVISSSPSDLKPVLDAIADTAARLCGPEMTMFFRFDGEAFRILASWNFPSDVQAMLEAKAPTPGHPSALGRAGATLRPAYISDVLADPDYGLKTEQNRALYRATLAVPMLREGRLVGALSLNRSEPGSFTQKHIDLVSTFADQAAIAFENARLFEEVRARTRDLEEALAQQTATADALKVISRSALGLREVMQTLIDSAVRLCADDGVIYLRRGDVFLAEAAYDADEEKIRARNRTPRTPGRGSVTSRVALSGEVEFIPDTLADGEFEVAPDLRLKAIRSLVGVPLLREGQVEGVFILGRREPGRFGARAVELAKTFADQAVIVIENVRLFEEVQTRTRDLEESLAQQTATADVLKVISSSAFDLQKVLDTLTESARRLCGADRATVHMRDGPLMKLRAQAGCSPEFVAYLEATPINPDTGRGQRTHVGMAVRTAAPVEIPDTDASETFRLGEASKLGDFRSIAGVPLLRDGKVEGVFSLARQATGSFTPRQIELLKTFADQAVIAIENARLFDEVQAKTRDLEESLAQQTATADVLKTISRSAFDLDAIFQTLVTTAVDLCKASSGTLCARDGDIFRYRGMAGPEASAELRAYLTQHPLTAPSRSTIAGRVILSGQAEEIHDVLRESGYVVPFASLGSPARALLGVPLLGKTQVQGAIVVARAEPGAFPARQVEILKTFADQAVIAIENSRLFNEVQARTRELEQSLADLRKAQDRLIQSEKLASLGQLTAGIAHEIKNPLNFVNNFASLSRDLLAEMKETLGAAPLSGDARAEVDELTVMLDSNLDKVVHHGKRADSIVKNMLLHSREGSGERARVNVNAMVEEALNLGYHGARAEKPGFNVTIERSLDPDAGEAELYLQEITRVLLNLISNGFYAAAKRKEAEGLDYQPTLTASTRALGRSVEVRIRDNGTGIPDSVREKMFNPFFTTKPAGEGTGLGLSLSHDIVVKQHGGTIEVETEPGHFTEFVITLPREGAKA